MQRSLVALARTRVASAATQTRGVGAVALYHGSSRSYMMGPFTNPVRRPQMTPEEREKVVVNQDEWPAEFKDFDPENPYKNTPDWIEGLTSMSIFLCAIEMAFVINFIEVVFPYSL